MTMEYRDTRDFGADELADLFLSVEWSSGKFPEKLRAAMRNSDTVISAWDGGRLIGLMSAVSDGVMHVYFHYLLVRPEYQGQGVGKEIVRRMLERYEHVVTKVLIAYNTQVGFYERCGFKPGTDKTPMFLTSISL
jgi:GNAT superfamily N-acetyltransferase